MGETGMIDVLPERLDSALERLLLPRERVILKLKGAFKEALICTDFRVVILKAGFMTGQIFGTSTFQAPYTNVTGAQVKFHSLTGYFELSAGGMQHTDKAFWTRNETLDPARAPNCIAITGKQQADSFRAASSFIMGKTSYG